MRLLSSPLADKRAQHRVNRAFLEQQLAFVGTLQALDDVVAVEVFRASIEHRQQHERDESAVEVFRRTSWRGYRPLASTVMLLILAKQAVFSIR